MGVFNIFRNDASLTIADCLNRLVTKVSNFPATLNGRSQEGETTPLCRISEEKGKFVRFNRDCACSKLACSERYQPVVPGTRLHFGNKITRRLTYSRINNPIFSGASRQQPNLRTAS